jgi:hydrogenase-4 component B
MSHVTVLLAVFLGLCALGVFAPIAVNEHRVPVALALLGCAASAVLIWIAAVSLLNGLSIRLALWDLTGLSTITLSLDSLSALFLLITGMVFFPASIFAAANLDRYIGRYSVRAFAALFFALFSSVALILVAGDAVSFLATWESMSILTYLLINFEHEVEDHTRSGYLMLAIGDAGTLAIAFAFFVLARGSSLEMASLRSVGAGLGQASVWTVFLLSFFGFGVKAGLIPVNFWLPQAYTSAPVAFAPVLAGATLNLGLYGIVRFNADLLPVTLIGPGLVALIIGSVSALLGILYATTQNDLKAILAHSSIENTGIIVAGLGAGFIFIASGYRAAAAIAFAAALYQMINHSLYKALLFIGAGAVDSNTGVRNVDSLGGLIKLMPWTAFFFLIGALSIAAMPPFNGFASEWLTLQTLLLSAGLRSTGIRIAFALCGAALALTAGLAVTCFVKVYAMSFLGMPRSEQASRAQEAKLAVTSPMAILALLCVVLGVTPTYVIPLLDHAIAPMVHTRAADALVPAFFSGNPNHAQLPPDFLVDFHDIGAEVGESLLPGRGLVLLHRGGKPNPVVFAMSPSYMVMALAGMLLITFIVVRMLAVRTREVVRHAVWDGGIRRLLPDMTYSATGFSNPVRVIFEAVFTPTAIEDTRDTVAQHFRGAIRRTRQENHLLDRLVLNPIRDAVLWVSSGFARMHHGYLNAYVVYGLSALLIALIVARFS